MKFYQRNCAQGGAHCHPLLPCHKTCYGCGFFSDVIIGHRLMQGRAAGNKRKGGESALLLEKDVLRLAMK